MRRVRINTFLESWESAIAAGMYGRRTKFSYRTRKGLVTGFLPSGRSDNITAWKKRNTLIVISTNRLYDYCGMSAFGTSVPHDNSIDIADIFFQSASENLAENWTKWSEAKLRRVLFKYWVERF